MTVKNSKFYIYILFQNALIKFAYRTKGLFLGLGASGQEGIKPQY